MLLNFLVANIYCLPCARHCSKYFTSINLLILIAVLSVLDSIIKPILQMRKLRQRDIKELTQVYIASKWQRQDLNSDHQAPEFKFCS